MVMETNLDLNGYKINGVSLKQFLFLLQVIKKKSQSTNLNI